MNKFKKIAMIAMSAVMCASVSVGAALISVSAEGTDVKGITSALAGQVVASEGATAAYGTKTLANVADGYATEYSGLVLTGGEGATFDLGSVDLSDFNWTNESTYDSFIEMVFAPSEDYTYGDAVQGEIQVFTLTLTDALNANNKIVMQINGSNYQSDTTNNPRSNFTTYAQFVDENGATQTQTAGTYRLNNGADQFISNGVLVTCGKKGNAWKPFKLVYDYNDNALYTPDVASNFPGSYELRKYGQTYTEADGYAQAVSGDANAVAFDGFTSGKVNVSIGFDLKSGATSSSVVLTSFAGVDLTEDKTLTLRTGTNVTDSLASTVVTSGGATAEYGTKEISDNVSVSGLVLTGGEGETFDFGTVDLSEKYWTDESDYASFIDFVVTPAKGASAAELVRLDIILTDAEDSTKSIETQMVRYVNQLTKYAQVRTFAKHGEKKQALAAYYDVNEAGLLVNTSSGIYKELPFAHATDAATVKPFSLVYDSEENALYTPNSRKGSATYGGTYLIRNFNNENDVLTRYNETTTVEQTLSSCAFSGKFNLTVCFALIGSVTETSIVVTGFMGQDLTQNAVKESYLTNAKVQVNGEDAANGATLTLGDTVSLVSTDANKSDFKSMTVNGEENTTSSFTVTLDMFRNSILTVGGECGAKYAITVDGETQTLWDIESYTLPTLENGIGYGLTGGGVYKSGEILTELSKEMEFTSLTVDVTANTQLSLADANANSGLRFVTQINQADLAKVDEYTDITFYAYLTLKEAFETKCSGEEFVPENINYDENSLQAGMNDDIASTDGYRLKVLKLTQEDTERWMSKGVDEGYLGFCMTLVDIVAEHYDDEYLFLPVMEISYANGATEKIVLADAADFAGSVKSISQALIADGSLYGEYSQIYFNTVTVGGETKYSVYDEDRLKVLYTWAGDDTVIGKENA